MFSTKLCIKFHFVQSRNKFVNTLWVSNVPFGLFESVGNISGITFSRFAQAKSSNSSVPVAPIQSELLSVSQHTVIGFQFIYIVKQLIFMWSEFTCSGFELINDSYRFVIIKSHIIWASVIRECPLTSEIMASSLVA